MSAAPAAAAPPAAAPTGPAAWAGALIIALLVAGTAVLAARSLPAADGIDTAEAVAAATTPAARREALLRHLERRPRDGRGWVVLGMMEADADRFEAAAAAFERAIAASPRVAADPAVWCELADALGMAQGGTLAGRPTELIHRALGLKATHPRALEMAGSAAYERREFAQAATYWKRLLPQLAEGSTEHTQLTAAIERAERLAATSLR